MKYILLTTIFSIILTFSSLAQPVKGDYILGGSLGFNFTSSPLGINKRQGLNFSIAPSFGKFISEKFLIDGGLGYFYRRSYEEINVNDYNKSIDNSFHIRFGVSRFFPIADKLFFTLGANIGTGYGFKNGISSLSGVEFEGSSRNVNGNIGISPGLTYFINNRWMVYTSMGTINYSVSYDSKTGRTGHSVNASLIANSFKIGISYIFKGKE